MKFTIEKLLEACARGGASHLVVTTEMAPAAGPFAAIAPARFTSSRGAAYAYETRWIDGQAQTCVLIDGKGSQENRIELPIAQAIADGHPSLTRMPRIVVRYPATDFAPAREFSDLELPHRWTDAHIRAGETHGESVVNYEPYRQARNASNADVTPLMELAPAGLVFGSWDSIRRTGQARYPSVLVGEVIGVLADQESDPRSVEARRKGARVDPVAASVQVTGQVLKELAAEQELSPRLMKEIKKRKDSELDSASALGFGSIPPGLDEIAGVSTKRIIRAHTMSFAALRRLRFGRSQEANAAARALLAAVAVWGLTASYSDGYLRANCHLVEVETPRFVLKGRFGHEDSVDPLTLDDADELLAAALDRATASGVRWDGQVLEVAGNPVVVAEADDTADEKA